MAIDYSKSPDEIIVQLINEENGRTIRAEHLDLNNLAIAPDPIAERLAFNNTRTSLRIQPAAQSHYLGEVSIRYNRVPVRDVFPNTDDMSVRYPTSTDEYDLGNHSTLIDILPDINARHAINIAPEDVFDADLPTFTGPPPYDPAYVRLEMRAGHKVFIGGINLRIKPRDWDLAGLQYTELNGLLYPTFGGPDPEVQVEVSTALNNTLGLMSGPGYWNYAGAGAM